MDIARFQEMYKNRGVGALAQSASLQQRVENLNKQRRTSRNVVMMKKRNIDEGALTPITSPFLTNQNTKNQTQVVVEENKTDHRLEMLKKWQEDKKKRIQKEKVNKKPLFKVQHVATSPRYDLDKVYGQIKGVTFPKKKKASQEQSRLAPSSTYKFKPPSNIKPINLKIGGTAESSSSNKVPIHKAQLAPNTRGTRSQKPLTSPPAFQSPVRTRQRLNFKSVEAIKNSPLKKKASVKTTIEDVATTEYAESSTSKRLQSTKGKIKKSAIKAVPITHEQKLVKSVTDLTSPLENEEPPIFNTYKGQKRRSRSVGTLNDDTPTTSRNRVTDRNTPNPRRRPITRQNCIDLTSRIVQNENAQEVPRKKAAEPQPLTIEEELCRPSTSTKTPEFTKTRRSKAKCSTMMKVTQAAKSAEKSQMVTPQNSQRKNSPKSILKSQRAKSAELK